MGFGTGDLAFASQAYELKEDEGTSHDRIAQWLSLRQPSRVLDLGCSDGALGAKLIEQGHTVIGVDVTEHKGVRERLTDFFDADLDRGIPAGVGDEFDVVLAADVIEHVRDPATLLEAIKPLLRPGGDLIVSIPNFGHWYPRGRVALGHFDYDARGILDEGHLRFFTDRSFRRLLAEAGWSVRRSESIGLPLGVADRGGSDEKASSRLRPLLARVDRGATALRPQLFAYQFLFDLEPTAPSRVGTPPAIIRIPPRADDTE